MRAARSQLTIKNKRAARSQLTIKNKRAARAPSFSRLQVLLKLIKPYTRIRIPFISKELNIPSNDVEDLLVALILDAEIHGHIDQVRPSPATTRILNHRCSCDDRRQVNQMLELGGKSTGLKKYQAIDKWASQLSTLHATVRVPAHAILICKQAFPCSARYPQ